MWSHYGDNHTGFCIGFHEQKLRESGKFGACGMVDYCDTDDYPFIDPLWENFEEKSLERTHSKSKKWIYEEEYRALKTFTPIPPKINDRLVNFDNDLVSEIVLGINISKKDKKEIINIARQKSISIFQAHKIPFKFLIGREEIM